MLRSFTVLDPHLVNSIRENPRYTKMTPKEILGKFVSGRMMIKEARYVDEALNGPMPIHEPQTVALKATSSREALCNTLNLGYKFSFLIFTKFRRYPLSFILLCFFSLNSGELFCFIYV
jgi:hypothetical protein